MGGNETGRSNTDETGIAAIVIVLLVPAIVYVEVRIQMTDLKARIALLERSIDALAAMLRHEQTIRAAGIVNTLNAPQGQMSQAASGATLGIGGAISQGEQTGTIDLG